MKVYYLSGPPGSGKTHITKKLEELGYITFGELVEPFPKEKYQDPRSQQTAEYIYEQMLVRDKLIAKKEGVIIVDRHPLDNLLVAKGLLQNRIYFEKLEKRYLNTKFIEGKVIELKVSFKTLKTRVLMRKSEIVQSQMWLDILDAYKTSNKYIEPDYIVDGSRHEQTVLNQVLKIVEE
jgi:adenylate kinase family enzyme